MDNITLEDPVTNWECSPLRNIKYGTRSNSDTTKKEIGNRGISRKNPCFWHGSRRQKFLELPNCARESRVVKEGKNRKTVIEYGTTRAQGLGGKSSPFPREQHADSDNWVLLTGEAGD